MLPAFFLLMGVTLAALFVSAVKTAWQNTNATPEETRKATMRAALVATLWLGLPLAAAAAHRLRFEPPTFMLMMLLVLVASLAVGLSRVGYRLAAGIPLAALVGVQSFRLPLELMMHRAYTDGLMPVQMSYSGYNFDIVTGATAIVVAILVASGKAGVGLVRIWNWVGTLLLANVLVIAVLTTPLVDFFKTEPKNVWITQAPFVWLPAVMVAMALLGHIVVFRAVSMARDK